MPLSIVGYDEIHSQAPGEKCCRLYSYARQQSVYLALKPNGLEWGTEDLISLRMGGVLLRQGKILPWRQEGGVAIQNGCH